MPKPLRLLAIAGIALVLTACQSAPQDKLVAGGCEPTASGSVSESVTVTGLRLSTPVVDFAHGLAPTTTERSVVKQGEGRIAKEGALVTFAYSAFNGADGKKLDSVGYEDPYTQATVDDSTMLPGLAKALRCGTAGSRLVAVIPPADAFGAEGNKQFGIAAHDSIVFVIDVVAVASDRADGKKQEPVAGMPRVEIGVLGEPRITIPNSTPPTAAQTALLKRGAGTKVVEGATVTIEYSGVLWSTGETFDSSWMRDDLVQLPTTSFIPGFAAALVGQTVGSQVLVVIPPELGYGTAGKPEAGISGTDTLVFVIDILAVVQPPGEPAAG